MSNMPPVLKPFGIVQTCLHTRGLQNVLQRFDLGVKQCVGQNNLFFCFWDFVLLQPSKQMNVGGHMSETHMIHSMFKIRRVKTISIWSTYGVNQNELSKRFNCLIIPSVESIPIIEADVWMKRSRHVSERFKLRDSLDANRSEIGSKTVSEYY